MADSLANHGQVVMDAILNATGEEADYYRLFGHLDKWVRPCKRKSVAVKLHQSDEGGFVYLIMDHASGSEIVKGCTDTKAKPLTHEERREFARQRQQRQLAAIARAARKCRMLSSLARRVWHNSTKSCEWNGTFEYLLRKREKYAKNARFFVSHKRTVLLLPMVCPFNGLQSLYLVFPNGFKRPLKGTASKGLMMAISDKPLEQSPVIWITEGYITGLTLHWSVSTAVVVAFTAGNLVNVVEKLVRKYPNATLKLCADNDVDTLAKRGFNPGIDAANKVKEAFPQVEIFIPEFPEGAKGASDYNDLRNYLQGAQSGRVVK